MKYQKLSTGNYRARAGKYFIFIRKRFHGGWNATISVNGEYIFSEGYFATSLPTISKAKAWVSKKLKPLK